MQKISEGNQTKPPKKACSDVGEEIPKKLQENFKARQQMLLNANRHRKVQFRYQTSRANVEHQIILTIWRMTSVVNQFTGYIMLKASNAVRFFVLIEEQLNNKTPTREALCKINFFVRPRKTFSDQEMPRKFICTLHNNSNKTLNDGKNVGHFVPVQKDEGFMALDLFQPLTNPGSHHMASHIADDSSKTTRPISIIIFSISSIVKSSSPIPEVIISSLSKSSDATAGRLADNANGGNNSYSFLIREMPAADSLANCLLLATKLLRSG
uniref:Uncharacterized protein n=1 Tax=Romanomermis culicivorax TaxID=13658 RepID=A0A915JR74_ROMCU